MMGRHGVVTEVMKEVGVGWLGVDVDVANGPRFVCLLRGLWSVAPNAGSR